MFVFALPSGEAELPDLTRVIGMDLKTAIDTFGLPQNMLCFRGTDEARDDVVFYYPDHMYLFWYKDRVWQVRFDHRSAGGFHDLSLGMTRQEVEGAVKERPLVSNGDSLYFDLDTADFPVRVRLVFSGSGLSDIYVFRSDF
jgi:hypothetical protein